MENQHRNFLIGTLTGGLIGVLAGLLFAPAPVKVRQKSLTEPQKHVPEKKQSKRKKPVLSKSLDNLESRFGKKEPISKKRKKMRIVSL